MEFFINNDWLSALCTKHGVQGVVGSNPAAPTILESVRTPDRVLPISLSILFEIVSEHQTSDISTAPGIREESSQLNDTGFWRIFGRRTFLILEFFRFSLAPFNPSFCQYSGDHPSRHSNQLVRRSGVCALLNFRLQIASFNRQVSS